ncbi:metallophosphoesterase family protein [Luteimonas sp. SDU82]|uniref:metallophosphoesterase family protein n=1 Tax=Luteimonas sp. SDU82 TaxID=3422592 RepID=UPI003EB98A9C
MRIALLADLHANREATEACLAALAHEGCERYVFLGDLVGYGADPAWVVDTVRAHVATGAVAVLGNHDQAATRAPSPGMVAEARDAIAWTRQRLDPEQLAFLDGLPLQVQEDDRLYVHANAWAPGEWGYVSSRAAATRSLEATTQRLTFCGHEHRPALYYAQPGPAGHFQPSAGRPVPLPGARRWLAIPGACGQPRDGDPAAACAVYDTDAASLTFLRVPYDHERAAAKIVAAGLPQAFATRLLPGA